MHQSKSLILLGAGREKKIYAVPPYTSIVSLDFEDYPLKQNSFMEKLVHYVVQNMYFLMKSSMRKMAVSAISATIQAIS